EGGIHVDVGPPLAVVLALGAVAPRLQELGAGEWALLAGDAGLGGLGRSLIHSYPLILAGRIIAEPVGRAYATLRCAKPRQPRPCRRHAGWKRGVRAIASRGPFVVRTALSFSGGVPL